MDIFEIVKKICETESVGCRELNKRNLAKEIMNKIGINKEAMIQEIPVDWNNSVCVLYLMPQDNNYYELWAVVEGDKCIVELNICGVLEGDMFSFYDDQKIKHILRQEFVKNYQR